MRNQAQAMLSAAKNRYEQLSLKRKAALLFTLSAFAALSTQSEQYANDFSATLLTTAALLGTAAAFGPKIYTLYHAKTQTPAAKSEDALEMYDLPNN